MNENLEVTILWRGKNRFEWEVADGSDIRAKGKESTVELARQKASVAVATLRSIESDADLQDVIPFSRSARLKSY